MNFCYTTIYFQTKQLLHTITGRQHYSYESSSTAQCDDPANIDNGMVTFTGNSIGDVATYTCDLGFELIGNGTATCALVDMDSAEFQPAPPACRREYLVYLA